MAESEVRVGKGSLLEAAPGELEGPAAPRRKEREVAVSRDAGAWRPNP